MIETPAPGAGPQRLHHTYAPWAVDQPERTALQDATLRIAYGALPDAVSRLAEALAGLGIRGGDRVMLVGENSVALALTILALSHLDAWSTTVNARLSQREIGNVFEHSGARRALYFDRDSPEAGHHADAAAAQSVALPAIRDVRVGPLVETTPEPVFDAGAEQVAALVYTSGTTGAAKGVMLTHANLLFVANNSLRNRRLVPTDVVYGVLPLSHVYGLSSLLGATLISGGSLLLVPRFDPKALAQALRDDGLTVLHGVPAMYARLLDWARQTGTTLSAPALRVAQAGGAPLTAPLKAAFEDTFGLVLHNGYGMTEASPSICQTRMDAPRSDCSVGQAIPGIEIRLHDAEDPESATDSGQQGGPERVGELRVRGPNIMKGYYRAPDATAAVLDADGWLRTGDLARIEADGAVFIVGRAKELIIRSGFNVYPVEVEQALNAHPDVVQSAVVGRDTDGNEEVIAFVETVAGRPLDEDALMRHLRDNLSPYKLPARIVRLPNLPATATGKVLKAELRRMAVELDRSPKDTHS